MIMMAVTAVLLVVLMMNSHVVMDLVSQLHGNVMIGMIVQTVLMKQIVLLKAVMTINLIVATVHVFMIHGNVMDG